MFIIRLDVVDEVRKVRPRERTDDWDGETFIVSEPIGNVGKKIVDNWDVESRGVLNGNDFKVLKLCAFRNIHDERLEVTGPEPFKIRAHLKFYGPGIFFSSWHENCIIDNAIALFV
jgi:hypothetical protein